jgi:hypothetical protein
MAYSAIAAERIPDGIHRLASVMRRMLSQKL